MVLSVMERFMSYPEIFLMLTVPVIILGIKPDANSFALSYRDAVRQ